MTGSPGSRLASAYVVATVAAWLAFLSVAGAYCPMTPPSSLPTHIAPAAACQLKAMVAFWLFLCAMSLAGVLLINRLGWRGRAFYVVVVLLPALLVALGQLLGDVT